MHWSYIFVPLSHQHVNIFLKQIQNYTNECQLDFLSIHLYMVQSETRQHSTQSVGNMTPPSPPHLLPQVLQIMPRNPKYDQFQPKGHHNEENPQSTTKMPGNPKFKVKIASKLEKSTNCNHNLTSSESGQDTSAYHITGHFLHAFSRKCPETLNLTRFIKSKYCQNYKSQQILTQNQSVLKVFKIRQHAKFQAIPSMRSPYDKPQIWPVSLSQNSTKIR